MKTFRLYLTLTVIYSVLTLLIFSHRVTGITTHYGLSNVDTDGTLWYYWAKANADTKHLIFNFNDYLSFPYGYDLSYIPYSSFVYDIHIAIAKVIGLSLKNLVTISNVSTLITYPLSAIAMFALAYYLTKNRIASFVSGLVFGFSYYHVLMGRGSLSTNHFYFIPLYFLSLLYYLDHRTVRALLVSALALAVTFYANAYWAFYSGIFSLPVLLFYKEGIIFYRLKTALWYLTVCGILVVTLNFNFFLQQAYNFSNSARNVAGRTIDMDSQLINLAGFITPGENNFLYRWVGNGGDFFLGYITLLTGFAGLLLKNKYKRTYYLIVVMFLLTIVLQAHTPVIGFVNDVYFLFFGFFRAVSRLIVLSSLFLAIMVAMSLTHILENRSKSKYTLPLLGVLTVIILLENLNTDSTWKQITPVDKLEKHYQVISTDKNVKSLAAYPMKLSNGVSGLPPNYQLIAQIVHGKKVVGGLSPFDTEAAKYYESVSDPANPQSVENLQNHGVDAVVVYSNRTGRYVTEILKKNPRLSYAGYYTYQDNASQNYDLFYIKGNYAQDKVLKTTTTINGTVDTNHVTLKPDAKPVDIIQTYPFNGQFSLYPKTIPNFVPDFVYLLNKPVNVPHFRSENYYNEWEVTPSDNGTSITFTSLYRPRLIEQLGNTIRAIMLIATLIIVFRGFQRK